MGVSCESCALVEVVFGEDETGSIGEDGWLRVGVGVGPDIRSLAGGSGEQGYLRGKWGRRDI